MDIGQYMPAINFKKVNEVIMDVRYSLPDLSDLLMSLEQRNKTIGTLDLLSILGSAYAIINQRKRDFSTYSGEE